MTGPYFDLYDDDSKDPFTGNYAAMYAEYDETTAPASIRNKIADQGNAGVPIHHLVHFKPSANPDVNPGRILTLHRITRYNRPMGTAAPTFDNTLFAFVGDSVEGQLPR